MTRKKISSGYWADLTTTDFATLDPHRTIVILPVAACEQHGPHLPLNTDTVINEGIVRAAIAQMPAELTTLVLPTQAVGDSLEHTAFPGTLNLDFDTLVHSWLSIGEAVHRAGLHKLIIFNSHGGQRAHVDQVAIRLRARHDMLVARLNMSGLGTPDGLFDADELRFGYHGGTVETSLMLHLAPHLVRREYCAKFASHAQRLAACNKMLGAEKPAGFGWMAQDLNPAGVTGDASQASADKGSQLLDHMAARLVQLCVEMARATAPGTGAGPTG